MAWVYFLALLLALTSVRATPPTNPALQQPTKNTVYVVNSLSIGDYLYPSIGGVNYAFIPQGSQALYTFVVYNASVYPRLFQQTVLASFSHPYWTSPLLLNFTLWSSASTVITITGNNVSAQAAVTFLAGGPVTVEFACDEVWKFYNPTTTVMNFTYDWRPNKRRFSASLAAGQTQTLPYIPGFNANRRRLFIYNSENPAPSQVILQPVSSFKKCLNITATCLGTYNITNNADTALSLWFDSIRLPVPGVPNEPTENETVNLYTSLTNFSLAHASTVTIQTAANLDPLITPFKSGYFEVLRVYLGLETGVPSRKLATFQGSVSQGIPCPTPAPTPAPTPEPTPALIGGVPDEYLDICFAGGSMPSPYPPGNVYMQFTSDWQVNFYVIFGGGFGNAVHCIASNYVFFDVDQFLIGEVCEDAALSSLVSSPVCSSTEFGIYSAHFPSSPGFPTFGDPSDDCSSRTAILLGSAWTNATDQSMCNPIACACSVLAPPPLGPGKKRAVKKHSF